MIINKISVLRTNNYKNNSQKNKGLETLNNKHRDTDKYNNISFKAINFERVNSLTEVISRQIYSKKRLIELNKSHPEAQGITFGTAGLPAAWVDRIKDKAKFDKESFCEKLGAIFTADRHYSDIDVFQKSLKELFTQQGIIGESDKLELKYLEKGFFGRAFQLIINDDVENSKVLKEYKRTYRYHNNHGNFSEQNIAEYINRYAGSCTNMVKYYFGDTKNGYMVVDYISPNKAQPENTVELDELGIAYDDDKPRNFVGDYIIDYGGIITINNLAGNKTAQDVHRKMKHFESNEQRRDLFDSIYVDKASEDYESKMVGLTHSIRFFPPGEQCELYNKMYDLNLRKVNVALVECIKDFRYKFNAENIINGLAFSEDIAVKKVVSREIQHFPDKLKHQLFETLSQESDTSIKKYLARNLNQYYRNIANRINIFDNLSEGADTYANIALANALYMLSASHRITRFESLYNKNDVIVTCALTRNIEVFEDDEKTMEKWVSKLMEHKDIRVKRALCESVKYMFDKLKVKTFEELLEVKDMNAKEFLAETIIAIPDYHLHPEWFEKLMSGAGNSVKRELAKLLSKIKYPKVQTMWIQALLESGDSSVKEIIKKQGLA